ncbi:MAG TPA: hypothetical protein PKM18_12240 [bacterium]|nr:hypothetical protein [bacterium]
MRNITQYYFSSHAGMRRTQRNIPLEIIFLALDEGKMLKRNKDRIILNKKRVKELFKDEAYDREILLFAEKCAPIVVVSKEGEIITVFRPTKNLRG